MMLASKLPSVGTTIFSKMSALAQQHQAINLAQGFPDFPCDPSLIAQVNEAMHAGHNQYAPMPGVLQLREELALYWSKKYQAKYDPIEEITITCGATEACFTALMAVLTTGDEVIILEPSFDVYLPAIQLCGAIPKFVSLQAPNYSIPWDEVEKQISTKTKLIIINSPHNPTGSIWSALDVNQLELLVLKYGLYVLSDEVYESMVFDGNVHCSASSSQVLKNRSFVIGSFGKTYHVTGWRLGFCMAPSLMTKEFRKIHQYNTFAAVTPIQIGVATYMATVNRMPNTSHLFESKRNYFLSKLSHLPLQIIPCKGTYFQLISFKGFTSLNDVDFSIYLTKEFKLAAIPISVFYTQASIDDVVLRFCIAKKHETLEQATQVLCRYFESL